MPVRDTGSLTAAIMVRTAERDLRRTLSPGERRDLLKDNTSWDAARIAAIVKELPEATRHLEAHKEVNFEFITRPTPRKGKSKHK